MPVHGTVDAMILVAIEPYFVFMIFSSARRPYAFPIKKWQIQYSCRYHDELAFDDIICNYRHLCALVCVCVFDSIYSGASLSLSVYV